ncbi:UNVERIFIED_CONTAM: hypothetical protein H355_002990 [Colinus virginianus]|nr:hypothetical protein H355_002990 [Colinus virginianus]
MFSFRFGVTLLHRESSELLKKIKAKDLTLETVDLEWIVILQIYLLVEHSPVEHLTVRNLIFRGPVVELAEYKFRNLILTPSADFFGSCPSVKELQAGQNPFKCSCELQDFLRLERQSGGKLAGWPEEYVCQYPEDLSGTQLNDFHLSELACNTTLLLVTALLLTLVLVAVVAFLCIYLDMLWYMQMLWQWTQTKRRAWHNCPEERETVLQFHAFISYSERDALWVKNELIPSLEKGEGSIRLCQHERNFIPGKSIVENIINCIEKSYKSIFVLSPNFVQSEWCHYELYFAHHKLFSENSNSLILILLEPIPSYVIPARYHKLKALMAKRTYLEWPKERSKRALFWANLRAAISVKLPRSFETNEEQSDVMSNCNITQPLIK